MPIKPQRARYFARQNFLFTILPNVPSIVFIGILTIKIIINIIYDIILPARYTNILYLGIIIFMFVGVFALAKHRKRLHRAFEATDFRVCVGCGYDIADQSDGSPCPECGVPINFPEFKHKWQNMFDPDSTTNSK